VRKVSRQCHNVTVISRETIHTLVKKIQGHYWTNERMRSKHQILFDEKLNEFGARLEHFPLIYRPTHGEREKKSSFCVHVMYLIHLKHYKLNVKPYSCVKISQGCNDR
jgi:hypothetical protein